MYLAQKLGNCYSISYIYCLYIGYVHQIYRVLSFWMDGLHAYPLLEKHLTF